MFPTVGGIFACSSVDVAFGSIDACFPLMIAVASGRVGDGGRNRALWESSGSELCLLLDNHQVLEQLISLHPYFSSCFI